MTRNKNRGGIILTEENMRRRAVLSLILVSTAALATLFILPPAKHLFATEIQNPWLSNLSLQTGRDATTEDAKTLRDCYSFPVQFLSYTNEQNGPSSSPRLKTASNCEVAGIGDYIRVGYGYKQTGYQRVHGIPGSDWTLVSYAKDSGRAFAIGQQPSMIGKFTAANKNNPLEGTFEVTDPGLPYIRNDLGQVVAFNPNSYNFSQNGRYIIAEALYAGLVRIDVETMKVKLFSNQTYSYGMGYDPTPVLAISNDGNTAMISNFEGGPIQLYDLGGCTASQIKAYNNVATGCKQPKDIKPVLKQQFPNYWRLYGMQFSSNDKSIRAVATEKNPFTGQLSRKVIDINQAGYQPESVDYIAMGDSFASGEGDMDSGQYEAGTDVRDINMCHLSKRSYPYLLNNSLSLYSFHSVACSGARSSNLIDSHVIKDNERGAQYISVGNDGTWLPGYKSQKSYINDTPPPSFITVSIGGNNVGFADKLTACVLDTGTCSYASVEKDIVAMEITKQYDELRNTYLELINKTNRSTKVYVIGYPQIIQSEGNCGNNVKLNSVEIEFVRQGTKYMNQVIKAAAEDAGAYYLDIENVLEGNNLCSDALSKTVNGITIGNDHGITTRGYAAGSAYVGILGAANESFHPNQNAQPYIKDKILQLTNGNPAAFTVCPDAYLSVCPSKGYHVPLPGSYFGQVTRDYADAKNKSSAGIVKEPPKIVKMVTQDATLDQTKIAIDNLKPNSTARVEIHSTPIVVGTFNVDQNGKLSQVLDLSGKVSPGVHELHVFAKNVAGEEQDLYQHILITGSLNDVDGNNGDDSQQGCLFIQDSGIDYDQDGVDDACDGQIGEAPVIPEEESPPVDPNTPQDTKTPLGESVAGLEVLLSPETPAATSQTTNLAVAPQQSTQSITTNNSAQNNQPVLGETAAVSTSPIHQKAEASLAASPKISSAKATYILFILIALSLLGLGKYAFAKARDE